MDNLRVPNGKRLLMSLFLETHRGGEIPPSYTLKDQDHNGFPSLYRLYIELEDVTEWEFANKYLSGWEHWQMLTDCTWFKPFIERWRQELELKIKARSIRALQEMADREGKEKFQANKALLAYEHYLSKQTKQRVGRPKKDKLSKVDVSTTLSSIIKDFNKTQETVN